jgi:hypothetical protein
MNSKLRIPVYLFLFFLTFLGVENKKPIDGILNRAAISQYTYQVGDHTSAFSGTAIEKPVVSKFRIKVRYMGGECSYSTAAIPHISHSFALHQAVKGGYRTPYLHAAACHLISLRGPPVFSVC